MPALLWSLRRPLSRRQSWSETTQAKRDGDDNKGGDGGDGKDKNKGKKDKNKKDKQQSNDADDRQPAQGPPPPSQTDVFPQDQAPATTNEEPSAVTAATSEDPAIQTPFPGFTSPLPAQETPLTETQLMPSISIIPSPSNPNSNFGADSKPHTTSAISRKVNPGIIAGVAVGVVALIALVILGVFAVRRKRRSRRVAPSTEFMQSSGASFQRMNSVNSATLLRGPAATDSYYSRY